MTDAADDEYEPLYVIDAASAPDIFAPDNLTLLAKLLSRDKQRYMQLIESWKAKRIPAKTIAEAERDSKRIFKTQLKKATAKRNQTQDDFVRDEAGFILRKAHNIRIALERMGLELLYNEFNGLSYIEGWQDQPRRPIDQEIMDDLWIALDDQFDFQPTKDHFGTVIGQTSRLKRFHPVREYITSCVWDRTPRLKTWLSTYAGVKDTPFMREAGLLFLKAAVARVFDPGCQFDEMLLFCGEQGLQKSTLIHTLCPVEEWFTDSMPMHESEQKIIEATRGKWIVEISDLKGSTKAETESVKAQLSRRSDRARMAYGRMPIDVPRQFVLFGTSNLETPLSDPTGNRRYWPALVSRVCEEGLFISGARRDRDQLWAEAYAEYKFDENIRLDPKLYVEARAEQASITRENPFATTLETKLDGFDSGMITSDDLWGVLGIPVGQRTGHLDKFGAAMKSLGWVKAKQRVRAGGSPVGVYIKGGSKRLIVLHTESWSNTKMLRYADDLPVHELSEEEPTEA